MATGGVVGAARFLRQARELFRRLGPRVAIHARLPGASGRRVWRVARGLAGAARGTGGWVVVNGRPDVALAVAGVRGLQLGGGAIPVAAARSLVGDRVAIGASVHDVPEALSAARDGADWVLLGTIFSTPSHPGRVGSGPAAVARCRRALDASCPRVALLAIGGIDAGNAAAVRRAGARGIAVVRAVWDAAEPVAAALNLLEAFDG